MKNDVILGELFPDAQVRSALQKITSLEADFIEISRSIGLEKEFDFQHSNLRRVDFSYSDLRGVNFTGADLSYSYGVDILVDETTSFDDAMLVGSVFAKRVRENELFKGNSKASQFYNLLKSGDTYDVAQWISSRSGYLGARQLKDISEGEAAIICQKLITDDIDLTKRTTLVYHLKDFTASRDELNSVVSDFVAFHLDNPSIIRGFVKVAGDLLAREPFVAKTILMLCAHRDENVRSVAFSSISNTTLFVRNFEGISALFFGKRNKDIRRRFILETANKLGSGHVLAVNTAGQASNVNFTAVLDVDEMLNEETNLQIRASQRQRSKQQSSREILERQQEVLALSPVIGKMLECRGTDWLATARARSDNRYDDFYRYLANKIDHGFRRNN